MSKSHPSPRRAPARRRGEDSEEHGEESKTGLYVGLGVGGATILGLLILAVVLLTSGGSDEEPSPPQFAQPAPPVFQPPPPPPKGNQFPVRPPVVDKPPLPAGNGTLSRETLERVKKATVYIRVISDNGQQSSGSGFFALGPELVVTNAHVIDMLEPNAPRPRSIQVVVDSNQKDEVTLPASVVAVDRHSDLAVLRADFRGLRARGRAEPPTLDIIKADHLFETQKVFVFGFPFGERLGKDITVTPSAVSSLRKDKDGYLDKVQVHGGMNPGNSGGPVTDDRGQVVGVAVSIIANTQINFAIPGNQVRPFLTGRVSGISLDQPYAAGRGMTVKVDLRTLDPLGSIRDLSVQYWYGRMGKPRPPEQGAMVVLPGDTPRQTQKLTYDRQRNLATAELALTEPPPEGSVLWVQPVVVNGDNERARLAAIAHPLSIPIVREPATLTRAPQRVGDSRYILKSKLRLGFDLSDGEEHSLLNNIVTRLAERVQGVDARGNGHARLVVDGKFEIGISLDGKAVPKLRSMQQTVQDVGRLAIAYAIDPRGNRVGHRNDLSRVPFPSRQGLDAIGSQVFHALQGISVPLPGRRMVSGDQWKATRELPILSFMEENAMGSLEMTYTYLGTRIVRGRKLAIIDLNGVLRSRAGNRDYTVRGSAKGTAAFDPAVGQIVASSADFDLVIKVDFFGETIQSKGSLKVEMTKEVGVRPGT